MRSLRARPDPKSTEARGRQKCRQLPTTPLCPWAPAFLSSHRTRERLPHSGQHSFTTLCVDGKLPVSGLSWWRWPLSGLCPPQSPRFRSVCALMETQREEPLRHPCVAVSGAGGGGGWPQILAARAVRAQLLPTTAPRSLHTEECGDVPERPDGECPPALPPPTKGMAHRLHEEAPGPAWAPAAGRRGHADPGAAQGRPPTREARRTGFSPASRTLPPTRDDPTQDDLQAGPVSVLGSRAGARGLTARFPAQEPLLPMHLHCRSLGAAPPHCPPVPAQEASRAPQDWRQTLGRCWALLPTHPQGEECSVTPGSQRKSQFF